MVTAKIWLAKILDRETLDRHVLKVTGYERLDLAVSSSCTVIVDVQDVQDNAPIFEKNSYYAEVREDAPIGTTVVSVFARDLDAGLNGQIEYSLKENEASNFLKIGRSTGVIQTARELDRETLDFLRFFVIATDHGQPAMSSDALVEIAVLDVNDNEPKFESEAFNLTILENITVPAVVFQVKAIDPDLGSNGQIHYSIVTSSSSGFSIDYNSGIITLHEKLSAKASPVSLLIRAKDSGQPASSSTTTCTIRIIDINDHKPQFVSLQQQVFVDENVPIGHEITRVFAVDEDSGENGIVRYSLEIIPPEETPTFEIDAVTGSIKTLSKLDRELNSLYKLKITAKDSGDPPLLSTASIVIHVRDVNDNAPYFEPKFLNLTFAEDTAKGTALYTVKALDKDEDQKMKYRIEKTDKDIFSLIDLGEQGVLLTLSDGFRKTDDKIEVVISATDSGGLKGLCTINFLIKDVNEAPYFLVHPYAIHIPESLSMHSKVLQLTAKDNDRAENARITYSIDSTDFVIDQYSGVISVGKPLDREVKSSYVLTINASDGGTPPLSATTTVEILLDDVNDNAPEFISQNYTMSISEDMPVGTSFMQVEAVDTDAGNNGFVDYVLSKRNDPETAKTFKLDMSSGTLRIDKKLDRELHERYTLEVIARDRGNPSLSSKTNVTVNLLDVNDNAPKFEFSRYDFWIAENSPIGTTVGSLMATDADKNENAIITFKIFGGSDAKLFDIETVSGQNGLVRVFSRETFDYEAKKNLFYFEIQASSDQLSTTVPVYVHISDVNDNSPQLRDFVALVANYEGEHFDGIVGNIPAFDPDHNATLEFYVEKSGVYDVDNSTGLLRISNLIERQIDTEFKACVSDGPNVDCGKAHLIYVYVNDEILRQSVTVQIEDLSRDDFLDYAVYHRFVSAISLLDNWQSENIRIFSIQSSSSTVNVSFSIIKRGHIQSSYLIQKLIEQGQNKLSELCGFKLRVLSNDLCLTEPCPYYQQCKLTNKVIKSVQRVQTDNFLLRSLDTINTFVCECPNGFISTDDRKLCNQRLDLCYSSPCLHGGICTSLENSFRCQCSEGWTGKICEVSIYADSCLPDSCHSKSKCVLKNRQISCEKCKWQPDDTDDRCRLRSISFNGTAFLTVPITLKRIEWTIEFSLATIMQSGIIMFVGRNDADFVEVSLNGGLLNARFSLGGAIFTGAMEDWKENRLNDGKWHKITVEFYERKMRLYIDDCEPYLASTRTNLSGYPKCATEILSYLDKKCLDQAVRCYRFLDITSGIYLGGRPALNKSGYVLAIDGKLPVDIVRNGFTGCISNFTIDGNLQDFSNFNEFEKSEGVTAGCKAKKNYCKGNVCHKSAKCIQQWNGYHCRCKNVIHTNGHCPTTERMLEVSFQDEESYVAWEFEEGKKFRNISFEFRTRSRKTQVVVMEFIQPSLAFLFGVDQRQGIISFGKEHYVIPYPSFSDGTYKSIYFEFSSWYAKIVIDHLYKKQIPLKTDIKNIVLKKLYSGTSPSSNYPQRFEGCIRNVLVNGRQVKVADHSNTKRSCNTSNQCSKKNACPQNSKCIEEYDRYHCQCAKGYFGDTCIDACKIKNICGIDGTCIRTNDSAGYRCNCSPKARGRNCERKTASRVCPEGWYGKFPYCRQCNCSAVIGSTGLCNSSNGQCLCKVKAKHYFHSSTNICVPCECGYGASDEQCSASGQCKCYGHAVGRRCDRCSHMDELLDRNTLKCVKIFNQCPSNIDGGIQWPSTLKGVTAAKSCPFNQIGLASRKCGQDGLWANVNVYNCTIPELQHFDVSAGQTAASNLANVSLANCDYLSGRNLDLVFHYVRQLIDNDVKSGLNTNHLLNIGFTKNIVNILQCIVKTIPSSTFATLLMAVKSYGDHLCQIHSTHRFLEPFHLSSINLDFAVDTLPKGFRRQALPKFNNFVDNRIGIFRELQMELICDKTSEKHDTVIFYSFVQSWGCINCVSPTVSISANGLEHCQIRITFPIGEENGWRQMECAQLKEFALKAANKTYVPSLSDVSLHPDATWNGDSTFLIALNETHLTCQFPNVGVFSVIAHSNSGALIRFYPPQKIPYTATLSFAFALLLTLLSAAMILCRRHTPARIIKFCIILSFAVNIVALCLIQQIHLNSIFYAARNAVISFCSSTLFAWLFLYSLHIYFLFTEGIRNLNLNIPLLIGFVAPLTIALVTFFLAPGNFVGFGDRLFWVLITPAIFLTLNSQPGSDPNWFRETPKNCPENDGQQCQSPLLPEKDISDSELTKNEDFTSWMPDIIPPSTYGQSNPLRQQLSFPRSESVRASRNSISLDQEDMLVTRTIPRVNILTPPKNLILDPKCDSLKLPIDFGIKNYENAADEIDAVYQNYSKNDPYMFSTFKR
uniref:Protocadherin Fat 4 n=1 Tax=Syphacia muris TaxID=451379 RepID=A0A0N5AHE5_9BILA